MAKNITYKPGDHLAAPVPAGTKSGTPLRIGALNAITITDVAKTDVSALNADGSVNTAYNAGGGNRHGEASVWFEGVVLVNVTAASAPAYGVAVNLNAAVLQTAAGGSLWGNSVDPAPLDNGDGTFKVLVRINN